ncbi:hypothetical protein GOQ27_02875 [Clostridium sp. D2Q-11]|uniref:Uncharacterized protein n=1 Tax=Anaeromonas frigoriresistens TaxID=2683708 RepID=A0A942UXF2_9FIRM|nr:hypothetical protein [Anaeromonas frigoriresistens]MBS4537387.1 hypothetical protein [Anaeromonas frigoriresistens]
MSDIEHTNYKLSKLAEMNLEGIINKETYEEKYHATTKRLEELKEEANSLDGTHEQEKLLKDKLKSFRKAFDNNELLEVFDREVFENSIDKVIIGKTDESGKVNPYSVTFVFKAGMELEEDVSVKKTKGIHGNNKDVVYSYYADDTCGNLLTLDQNKNLTW